MKTSEKIVKLVFEKFQIECYDPYSLHTGYWQKSQGAWSWAAFIKDSPRQIGSQWTMKQVLDAKKLSLSSGVGGKDINVED